MSARVESNLPPSHHSGYSLHQSYQSNANSGYRSNNTHLNGGGRLGAASSYTLPSPSSNTGTLSNSIGLADPLRTAQPAIQSASNPDSMPEPLPAADPMSNQMSKKRQRSRERREPDWNKFYEKGLPSEVIVIDDSPTPEQSASIISNGEANSTTAGDNRHAAKKRKRDDVGAAYDPVYQGAPHSNNQTPQYGHSASGSTISTDRTTSAIHTTAATSLGSHSSNGQTGYEAAEAQPGQKRKRTATRLQLANEAKRRELETSDAFSDYQPPPRPPIKAPDVQVKQIQDVSTRDCALSNLCLPYFRTPIGSMRRWMMRMVITRSLRGKT